MKTSKAIVVAFLLFAFSTVAVAAELVVIGHPSASSLSKAQVADIYLGKTSSGTLYDLPENSTLYASFYEQATGRNVSQVKSTWARIVFSGQAQAPTQLPDSSAVKRAVAEDPRAIGYIEKSALDSTVKVLLDLN
ncbi:hypothetical protein KZO25_11650 [Halomonas sp. ANAO-440]|uniref:hypothetical protein n=1 Tax=Halomonas sp. ANAO-440 TaxID=2861360 RepID=UPI001CAA45F4|nr:hypothetical protein [Halomonas sp. ANAO-440]MBZ0330971.1 hypothetical protein [Halomonas sp. ANAO-440]